MLPDFFQIWCRRILSNRYPVTEKENINSSKLVEDAARVHSALMELLPSGECTIDDVAKKLGYSKRTLQQMQSSIKMM